MKRRLNCTGRRGEAILSQVSQRVKLIERTTIKLVRENPLVTYRVFASLRARQRNGPAYTSRCGAMVTLANISGEDRHSKTDVRLVDRPQKSILLLVHADK